MSAFESYSVPHVSSRGRTNFPIPASNAERASMPEVQPANPGLMPRGQQPSDTPPFEVESVDMLLDDNKKTHKTQMYKNSKLVLRRGWEFFMAITFNRHFDESIDKFMITFQIGEHPTLGKGTCIIVSFGLEAKNEIWDGRVKTNSGTVVTVGITTTSDCIVGKFSTTVTTGTKQESNPDMDVYILFNAWSPNDDVFIPNDEERTAYVLAESGVIYTGTVHVQIPRPWNYGQFQPDILDACLFVLDASKMPLHFRGDIIAVARQCSAIVNSPNDDGVLIGNWSGIYILGTSPSAWTGSIQILRTYAKKGLPIAFAQCWVYAGVLNTIMRCLGVPSRVVTNYFSAHDNNGDLKIDIVIDSTGRMDPHNNNDSVWNYHCWNEVYFKRGDLPDGFSGWQALDSTPQETSDGFYRCGPASVRAIKEGMLCYPFDARFIFAEVNSHLVYKMIFLPGQLLTIYVDKTFVGQRTVTQNIVNPYATPIDLTGHYKYLEGSVENQATFDKAEKLGCKVEHTTIPEADVKLHMFVDGKLDEDIELKLDFESLSMEPRTVQVVLDCSVIYYTGVYRKICKSVTLDISLDPMATSKETVTLLASEYMKELVENGYLQFFAYCIVEETNISFVQKRVLFLSPPELLIEASEDGHVGREMYVKVSFTNQFSFNLENVELRLEGPGLLEVKISNYRQIIPGATVTLSESLSPRESGTKTLVAILDCAVLRQVSGHLDVTIKGDSTEDAA